MLRPSQFEVIVVKGGQAVMDGSKAAAIFGKIVDDVVEDRVTTKIALELQMQCGILTEDDLKKVFTI